MKFIAIAALALVAGCATRVCDASRCPNGCCSDEGVCLEGRDSNACGKAGERCRACVGFSQCEAQTCTCIGGAIDGVCTAPLLNVVIIVDTSATMALPLNALDPACPAADCPGAACPAGCKTRLGAVRSAVGGWLSARGKSARFGLMTFPQGSTCGAPSTLRLPLSDRSEVPGELQAHADAIAAELGKLSFADAMGERPTGATLQALLDSGALDDAFRSQFVILITDGAPGCGVPDPSSVVTALTMKGVRTIMVGFGPGAATPTAATALNAMAEASGFQRTCPNGGDAECGPSGPCDQTTRVCATGFYTASTGPELAGVLYSLGL